MTIARYILRSIDAVSHKIPFKPTHKKFATLDPFLVLLLQIKNKRQIPALSSLTPQQARELYATETARISAKFKVTRIKNIEIPIATTHLQARAYYPKTNTKLDLLVYFHGGGGVIGDLNTHDDLCRLICQTSNMVVVSVAYRLAPEYPHPIAHHDAYQAAEWLYHHRHKFEVFSNGISVAGDSAGGNIAIFTALELARHNIPVFGQLLLYPSADFSHTYPSEHTFATDLFLDFADREWFKSHCIQGISLDNPIISPLLRKDLNLAPKTVLHTAELDVLRDEAEALVAKLNQQGVDVVFKRNQGVGHGYGNLVGIHQCSYQYVVDAVQSFKALIQK